MDDEQLSRTPVYLRFFDITDAGFPWRELVPDQIVRRRADMNDKFIFDILLIAGGVEEPDTLFPPRNVEDLKALLLAIEDSTYDILKQESLVYMLLKWHQDAREERFQLDRCIPPHFAALADAYWHLDTGINVPRAVSILSDNRLNGEYASKILHAISISPEPSRLIVQYVRTARPLLVEPQDIWMYTLALADSSLREAWFYQRTFSETDELREQLLERLFHWCIFPEPRPQALKALLVLPLSPFEEKLLHKYALEPPKDLSRASIATLRDLLCVRFIQSGQYAEAIRADHQFALSTLNETKSDSRDRRKMVKDVYDALPQVERMLLDLELEGPSSTQRTKPTTNGIIKPSSNTDVNDRTADLSHSWEDVSRPLPSQSFNDSQAVAQASSPYRDILESAKTQSEALPISHSRGSLGHSMFSGAPSTIPVSFPSSNTLSRASPIRQGFPLSNSTPGRSQPLLTSNSPMPLIMGSNTASGALTSSGQFPTSHQQLPTSSIPAFVPATRQPNAFYQPPPLKHQQGVKRPIEALTLESSTHDTQMDGVAEDDNHDMDLQNGHEEDQEDQDDEQRVSGLRSSARRHELEDGVELPYSVFGNGPQPSNAAHPRQTTKPRSSRDSTAAAAIPTTASATNSTRTRVPPGGFISDDEDGGVAEHEEQPPAARTRTSARSRQNQTQDQDRGVESRPRQPNKRAKRSQKEDLGRSLPGTLIDEDEDDGDDGQDDDEEADRVAPLPRQTSPPPLRRNTRRMRSTTPASDIGDEDGTQKRRRSSRLSTAASAVSGSSPPAKKGPSKGKKNAKASGGATTRNKRS